VGDEFHPKFGGVSLRLGRRFWSSKERSI